MKFIEQLKLIERLHCLIQRKATGTPEQLANRLQISRASVFRHISHLKALGTNPYFCKDCKSYRYEEEFNLSFSWSLNK